MLGARPLQAQQDLPREPPLGQILAAAGQAMQGAHGHEGLARRARLAGWVPQVRVGMRRGQGLDYALVYGDGPARSTTDDDMTLFASLTFRLDRVVFRREEVAIGRDRRAADGRRERLLREVVEVYFEWQRLRLQRRQQGSTPERELAIARAGALLGIFTNGAFDRMMGPQEP